MKNLEPKPSLLTKFIFEMPHIRIDSIFDISRPEPTIRINNSHSHKNFKPVLFNNTQKSKCHVTLILCTKPLQTFPYPPFAPARSTPKVGNFLRGNPHAVTGEGARHQDHWLLHLEFESTHPYALLNTVPIKFAFDRCRRLSSISRLVDMPLAITIRMQSICGITEIASSLCSKDGRSKMIMRDS